MKNTSRGFEFAIISSFGGLGEMLGNLILGKIVNTFSLNYVVMIFCVSYFMIAIMAGMGFKNEKIRILE